MKTYQAGNSGNYAEVIIDFRKKKVKLTDPQENNCEFKKNRFGFNINSLSLIGTGLLIIAIKIIYNLFNRYNPNPISLSALLYLWLGLLLINYIIGIIYHPKYNDWIDKWTQKIFTGYLGDKKVIIIKEVKENVWKLPYEFKNNQLDYKLYGDYKKFITKIHIKPKDYYIKSFGKIKKQIEDWEAFFYFSKIPKKGKMIIEFN